MYIVVWEKVQQTLAELLELGSAPYMLSLPTVYISEGESDSANPCRVCGAVAQQILAEMVEPGLSKSLLIWWESN